MPDASFAERLSVYKLRVEDIQLTDLTVEPDQEIVLSRQSSLRDRAIALQPTSVGELKKFIGTPDTAFARSSTFADIRPVNQPLRRAETGIVFNNLPNTIDATTYSTLYSATHEYVFGDSTLVHFDHSVLTDWLMRNKLNIISFFYQDIHIARNAQLTVAADTYVLFARYITIEKGGRMRVMGTSTKIDCAGLRGL